MVGEEEVQDYFFSRPRESQIAASISWQSQPIETRLELERRYEEFETKHDSDLVLPAHWKGYRLSPSRYEFWQGRKRTDPVKVKLPSAKPINKNQLESFENTLSLNLKELNEYNSKENG